MKRLLVKCAVWFVVLPPVYHCPLGAQDLVERFRSYIPPAALDTPSYRQMVRTNLDQIVTIHPDLLYFYFETVNVQFSSPGTQEANIALSNYNRIKRWYQNLRAQWAADQLAIIDTSVIDGNLKYRAQQYFQPIRSSAPSSTDPSFPWPSQIDTSRLDFLALKFLLQDSIVTFTSTDRYDTDRTRFELGYRDSLARVLESTGATVSGDPVPSVCRNWYLFYRPLSRTDLDPLPAQLAISYLQQQYAYVTAPPRLFLGFGFSPLRKANMIYKYRFANIDYPDVTRSVMHPTWTVSATYRYQLKSVESSFAFISADVHVAYSHIDENTPLRFEVFSTRYPTDRDGLVRTVSATASVDSGRLAIHDMIVPSVSISTPIAFPLPHVSLLFGATLSSVRLRYSLTYDYNYLTTVDGAPLVQGREAVTNNDVVFSKTLLRPFISAEYNGLSPFLVNVSASIDIVELTVNIGLY